MEVHIYIGTDSKAPRTQTRKYGYVLACILKGKLETKQEFRETKGTYNRATLEAITEAVGRVVKPSEIHIHTENAFILTMLEENLDRWEQNGYVTTKGEPVANGDLWKQLKEKAREHLLLSEPGKHEYSMWIQEQLKRATINR